mgnify:FL=1
MVLSTLSRSLSAWQCAFIGALASVPLILLEGWLPGTEIDIGGGIMMFGGLIAGFIAVMRSAKPDAAGLRAGLLGGVVAIFISISSEVSFAAENTAMVLPPASRILVFFLFSIIILVLTPLFGLIFGLIGGRVAATITS